MMNSIYNNHNISYLSDDKNRILLSSQSELYFERFKNTTASRLTTQPQLNCFSGDEVCQGSNINEIICKNLDITSRETIYIHWECKPQLESRYHIYKPQVVCEGYEHDFDPYILKDSCGLYYQLRYQPVWINGWEFISFYILFLGSGILLLMIFAGLKFGGITLRMIYGYIYPEFSSNRHSESYQPLSSQHSSNYNSINQTWVT